MFSSSRFLVYACLGIPVYQNFLDSVPPPSSTIARDASTQFRRIKRAISNLDGPPSAYAHYERRTYASFLRFLLHQACRNLAGTY